MNRVYGVIGIKSIMANWNADFGGYPKTIGDGSIFGSDKALKYSIKKYWEDNGEKILYIKSFKTDKDKIRPRSLEERYNQVFNTTLTKKDESTVILKNLFSALDVKSFGATFAEEGNNISLTGAVQIGQGFNVYRGSSIEEQQILSPFRSDRKVKDNEEAKEANQSTLGTKIVSDEAHYLYPFYINPISYKDYVDMGVTEGYTEDDYRKFKEGALIGATALNTNAKAGCENEFSLFIETDEETYLPNLTQFMNFDKDENGENSITFAAELNGILQGIKEDIKSIEIYYNNYKLKLSRMPEGAKKFNIFTRKEV
ncbi:type I CRISPR-associated protein Cas7 [Clostridium luticellarii]|jgi:CRISPR-associated protein Csh2|uniref:type I CRISPR-associated protein Cas7 n=1 Tax=Clostridium luticellarii TaxID=1691940 RepID=UPI002355BFD1|nr:type I CRISPR-associated protein Cas7 [Clostridium luticellarii]MCI1946468.1 type I CRISPR-associated protein Cas7 [Clostridium luticellarii]